MVTMAVRAAGSAAEAAVTSAVARAPVRPHIAVAAAWRHYLCRAAEGVVAAEAGMDSIDGAAAGADRAAAALARRTAHRPHTAHTGHVLVAAANAACVAAEDDRLIARRRAMSRSWAPIHPSVRTWRRTSDSTR